MFPQTLCHVISEFCSDCSVVGHCYVKLIRPSGQVSAVLGPEVAGLQIQSLGENGGPETDVPVNSDVLRAGSYFRKMMFLGQEIPHEPCTPNFDQRGTRDDHAGLGMRTIGGQP